MPPWFADPHYGKFANDRSLTQREIDTLVAWVDGGAPKGDPKDAPAPRELAGRLEYSASRTWSSTCRSRSKSRPRARSTISTSWCR